MTTALMLPTFQQPVAPAPLPTLDLPARPIEVGDHADVPYLQSGRRGCVAGIVARVEPTRVLLDQHGGGGRHWHDLPDVRRTAMPDELIEDHFASRPPVIVVPCGKDKLDEPARAGDLYIGGQHRLARQAADVIAAETGGRVVILSALHGLVDLDRILEPYDVTLGDERAVTANDVKWQLSRMGATRIIALTPRGYTDLLRCPWFRLDDRLAGTVGIGDQRGRLAQIRDGRQAA